MKRALLIIGALCVIGGAGYAYYTYEKKPAAPTITTAAITRGDVVDTVGATGTLQAVKTVQVGTQVSASSPAATGTSCRIILSKSAGSRKKSSRRCPKKSSRNCRSRLKTCATCTGM